MLALMSRAEKDAAKNDYDRPMDDYLEMYIQLGNYSFSYYLTFLLNICYFIIIIFNEEKIKEQFKIIWY
jgi:hypothetical protein